MTKGWVNRVLEGGRAKVGLYAAQALAVLAFVLSGFFLHRIADFNAHCYTSQIIDKLIMFSNSRREALNCRFALQRISWIPVAHDRDLERWGRESGRLDRLREFWPDPGHGLHVAVLETEPFAFFREGRYWILGEMFVRSPRQWSQSLTMAWLGETTQGLTALEQYVLSEFLTSVVEYRYAQVGLDQSELSESETTWSFSAIHKEEYCVSPWRRPEELEICQTEQGENFRPLLSRALWTIYREAGWRERRQLMAWLAGPVAKGQEPLLRASPEPGREIRWLRSEIQRWSAKTGRPSERVFQQRLWAKLGLKEGETPFVLVDAARIEPLKLPPGAEIFFRQNGKVIGVARKGASAGVVHPVRPRHVVRVICGERPPLKTLADLAERTVLVVFSCDSLTDLKGWGYVADHQLKEFVAANPARSMIWLDTAVLRQTLAGRDGRSGLSLKRLRRMSHWREDLWDKSLQAFVPRAALDLVLSHRASRDLL